VTVSKEQNTREAVIPTGLRFALLHRLGVGRLGGWRSLLDVAETDETAQAFAPRSAALVLRRHRCS